MNGFRQIALEKRDIHDLLDVLRIARTIGKKIFKVNRITVLPTVVEVDGSYLVWVAPEHDGGSESSSGRGNRHKKFEHKN